MRRYPYIDVARGIGMVLVVAGHAMGISMYLTCFFMQLFFVLSGYVYRQGKSYKQNMNVVFGYRDIVFKVLLL